MTLTLKWILIGGYTARPETAGTSSEIETGMCFWAHAGQVKFTCSKCQITLDSLNTLGSPQCGTRGAGGIVHD